MNLSDLRSYVRTQTQTLASELPDSTIDIYLQEAFNRTINLENRWPFYEKQWDIPVPAGEYTFTLPGDVSQPGIVALQHSTDGYTVDLMDHAQAQELFAGDGLVTSQVFRWSLWAGEGYLWPQIDYSDEVIWKLQGYRLPTDWISQGSAASPDCDSRLHQPLAHYAIALAYAQQEDEVLERSSMERWQNDVMLAREQIMLPPRARPVIMGRRFTSPIGRGRGGGVRGVVDTTGL